MPGNPTRKIEIIDFEIWRPDQFRTEPEGRELFWLLEYDGPEAEKFRTQVASIMARSPASKKALLQLGDTVREFRGSNVKSRELAKMWMEFYRAVEKSGTLNEMSEENHRKLNTLLEEIQKMQR